MWAPPPVGVIFTPPAPVTTVTVSQPGDAPQMSEVLDRVRVPTRDPGRPSTTPSQVLADKAYSSRRNRSYLRGRGIDTTIS